MNLNPFLPFLGTLLLSAGALLAQENAAADRSPFSIEFHAAGSDSVPMEIASGLTEDMSTTEFAFELSYEHSLDAEGHRVLGLALEVNRDEWSDATLFGWMPETLTGVSLEVSYLQIINDRWSVMAAASAGWHTAGEDEWNSDGFGVQGFLLARYAATPTLAATFGIYGDSLGIGSKQFNPILGIEWLPAPRWRLTLGVPSTGVYYEINDTIEVGLQGSFRSDFFALDPAYRMPRNQSDEVKLELLDIRAGGELTWHFSPQASLQLEGGAVLYRELKFHYGANRQKFESDGVGGYGQVNLSFRF